MRTTLSRREQLIVEVTHRLHTVCGHLPPGEFADLVLRVVNVTLKYEQETALSGKPGSGATHRAWGADVN
jgi:hypothetical protein